MKRHVGVPGPAELLASVQAEPSRVHVRQRRYGMSDFEFEDFVRECRAVNPTWPLRDFVYYVMVRIFNEGRQLEPVGRVWSVCKRVWHESRDKEAEL